jgi:hypothetical protein
MRYKIEVEIDRRCGLCGFYKSSVCQITKHKKGEYNKCDVRKGDRLGFIYKGGLITK